jgi:hypothetical protein
MFCSSCGTKATGKFCSACGAMIGTGTATEAVAQPSSDWNNEVNYAVLMQNPAVREQVSRHAAMAKKSMSSEAFLAFADKVIPSTVPMEKMAAVLQPISGKLGIKTGKEKSETLTLPAGRIIVAALCSLARNSQSVRQVQQFDDGCLLEATLPSDMWALEGTLTLSVRQQASGTRVDGATRIVGQLFDWGKSKQCLETLFADIKATPA